MNTMRYACCIIPDFPITLWLHKEPLLAGLPLAVAEKEGESSPLVVFNEQAEQAGVSSEMTVAQAHSVCPNLQIKIRAEEQERTFSRELVSKLQTLSPFVEESSCGLYFLNAAGLRFVYDSESAFAQKITTSLQSFGLPVQIGIAANKFTAQVAAQTASVNDAVIVSTRTERQFLSPLSINYLPVSDETKQSLYELGLRTIGQLAAFPANELMERFATDGLLLARLATGNDPTHFAPEFPPELLSKQVSLNFALFNTQTLLLYVEHILESLLNRLRQAGRCCTTCLIECHLEDKTTLALKATLDQPNITVTPFIRQLRQLCESVELTAGISDITVSVPESSVLILEQLAFQQHSSAAAIPDKTSQMARLAKQYNMFTPELHQAHLPEQNFKLIPATNKKGKTNIEDESNSPLQPYASHRLNGFRLLNPPLAGDLISTGRESLLFRFKQKLYRIERKHGPWKLSGGWWSDMFDRLYYEIQTTDRKLYLVYFDRLESRWLVQGVFD